MIDFIVKFCSIFLCSLVLVTCNGILLLCSILYGLLFLESVGMIHGWLH
jgi:hypothetical protein